MKKTACFALIVPMSIAVIGCQSTKPDSVYLEAAQIPEKPEPVVKEVEVPKPTPQLRPLPATTQPNETGEADTPEEAIAKAKEEATHGPATAATPWGAGGSEDHSEGDSGGNSGGDSGGGSPAGFIEAVQTYDYMPGVVYEVYGSPGHLTTIALRPGEKLLAKAAGDTARWFVGDSHTGKGKDSRTLLLVKPRKPGVETNLIVSTNERLYQIDLKSLPDTYHSEVRWNYPRDVARQLADQHRKAAIADDRVIDQGLDLAELDFGYRIRHVSDGERPDWTPRRVFTDGRKTYIAFPEDLAAMKAPPLFVLGPDDETQLVNYRVKADYYIVDRVIEKAELRLGEDPQQIVRIERIEQ